MRKWATQFSIVGLPSVSTSSYRHENHERQRRHHRLTASFPRSEASEHDDTAEHLHHDLDHHTVFHHAPPTRTSHHTTPHHISTTGGTKRIREEMGAHTHVKHLRHARPIHDEHAEILAEISSPAPPPEEGEKHVKNKRPLDFPVTEVVIDREADMKMTKRTHGTHGSSSQLHATTHSRVHHNDRDHTQKLPHTHRNPPRQKHSHTSLHQRLLHHSLLQRKHNGEQQKEYEKEQQDRKQDRALYSEDGVWEIHEGHYPGCNTGAQPLEFNAEKGCVTRLRPLFFRM